MIFNKKACDRCCKPSKVLTMSMFNTEMVCDECKCRERKHPDYIKAREVEAEHVMKGDYKFKGIGKPKDL